MRRILLPFIALLAVSASLYAESDESKKETDPPDIYTVTKVIEGDTILLSNGERVRLIGIDCKETEFTRKLVDGKEVRLEYDAEKTDKDGRTLAYVFVDLFDANGGPLNSGKATPTSWYTNIIGGKYGVFINATLVKTGYASPASMPPNVKYDELFEKLYKQAKEANRGLWKTEVS